MRNRTYGGVRGRKTKVGRKLLRFPPTRFLDEHRHELPEQLTHGVHALLTSLHVVKGMAHGEEHRFHSSSVRCGVQFRIALGNIRDGNEVGSGLKVVKTLFKTFQSRTRQKVKFSAFANLFMEASRSKNEVASQFIFLCICFIAFYFNE